METLQKLFAFMRANGFNKASWDSQLTMYPAITAEQMPNIVEQLFKLDDEMRTMFGDRPDRPLWFHV